MNKKRFLVILGLLLIVSMLTAACASTEPTEEPAQPTDMAEEPAKPAEPEEGAKKIGFSVYDMQYGFFQDMEAGTREAAEAAGYEYTLVDQKSSESTMVASTMDLLNQGVDALIISPFKPDAMGPIVDAAKEKGIPV
ncbi:MAG: substrate-binding domain-containing protein, partial [Anaerolineae bacterium]